MSGGITGLRPAPLFLPLSRDLTPPPPAPVLQAPAAPVTMITMLPRQGAVDPRLAAWPCFPSAIEVELGDNIETILERLLATTGSPNRDALLLRIHTNHPGIDVYALRLGQTLNLDVAEMRAPTQRELLTSPIVRRAVEDAWRDSLPHNVTRRHEEGGFIYLNTRTGVVFTHRAESGGGNVIDLSTPVLYVDSQIVGTFHTHPQGLGHEQGPSASDEQMEHSRGVPGVVRSHAGYFGYGPERRASLQSSTGFYPGTPTRPLAHPT